MVMGTEAHNLRAMAGGFKYDHQLLSNQNAMDCLNLVAPGPFLDPNDGLDIGPPVPFLDPNDGLDVGPPDPFLDPNNLVELPYVAPAHGPAHNPPPSSSSASSGGDHHEDTEVFSDLVLNYISRMLMEEDMDEKPDMYQEPSAIQAAEKPFYEILGQKYPFSADQLQLYSSIHPSSSSDDSGGSYYGSYYGNSGSISNSNGSGGAVDHRWDNVVSVDYSSQSSFSSPNGVNSTSEGWEDAFLNTSAIPDLALESLPAWQFMKGVEEARKFLPSEDKLVIDLEANGFSFSLEPKEENKLIEVKAEEEENEYPINGSRGRKHPHREDLDLEEGRSVKQSAVYSGETVRTEMFDRVLLCADERCGENGNKFAEVVQIREAVQNEAAKNSQNAHSRSSGGGKGRGKKQSKKEVVDLRTLLIQCAQMVAADDRRSTSELLKQIRQHSSPFGDGSQRLAHYFADGLEARLAGTGSQIYHSLTAKRRSASDLLRAYQLYLAACPFKRIMYFFANMTILNVAEKATRLHIVDFGIYYGFQWPCFIDRLSKRPGGPPKLRITGIDVPQPGFRPSERIEETGLRLADYAQSFGVPFEYQAIASNWEAVRLEDLHINKDELLVVNCLNRSQNLLDETVSVDSPRNMFLNIIRKMNPDIFILNVVNGSYSAPFFVTRFREALFHFSALFDMLETNVPREEEQRILIERDLFAKEAINVISCEGLERVERPETYKQWQVRNRRAGFEQVPLNPDLMKRATDKVRGSYHKDFIIDGDSGWMLQGWKGRITQGISTWKPANTH